jgi:hypothetical protein
MWVVALLGVSVTHAQGTGGPISSDIGYPTVAAASAALRGNDKVPQLERDGWTYLLDLGSATAWQLSLPGNPAHPSAIKTTAAACDIRVLCEADRAACARLIADIQRTSAQAMSRCRQLADARGRASAAPDPSALEQSRVKVDAVVTFDGPAKRCQVMVTGDPRPHLMPCRDVVSYLRQTRKLLSGAYVDEQTIPDVDVAEFEQVTSALEAAGYRLPPGVHVGFLTEPHGRVTGAAESPVR